MREQVGKPVKDWKVWGETAIPTGKYQLVFETSKKFGPQTLTLLNVPGFEAIRIHSGNTEEDTEGCLIVGYQLTATNIIRPGSTRPCLKDLKEKVTELDIRWLTISGIASV